MKWIGLTGGIATGKSTVAGLFRKKGVPVIDADIIAHQALVASSPVFAKLVSTFGTDIVGPQGDIDRARLGKKIFQDKKWRLQLDNIVHPFVREHVALEKQKLIKSGHTMAIYDVPLLFEKNMQDDFDLTIVVSCDANTQKERLMKRNSLTEAEAEQRIAAQIPMNEKIKRADVEIKNNSDLKNLEKQVDTVLKQQGFFSS